MELMVLMSEMPLAPAFSAACAGGTMLVTLGVSFTMTGMLAALVTQPVIISQYSGTATARPCRAAHAVRAAVVELYAVGAVSSICCTTVFQACSLLDTMALTMTARSGHSFLISRISFRFTSWACRR